MKKITVLTFLVMLCCQLSMAQATFDDDLLKSLEKECSILKSKQRQLEVDLSELSKNQRLKEQTIRELSDKSEEHSLVIDSLTKICKQIEATQSADRTDINGKIEAADNHIRANFDILNNRTLCGGIIASIFLIVLMGVIYRLSKRVRLGNNTIDEVRKAQEALKSAQKNMQEESVKLDNRMLDIVQKQLKMATNNGTAAPDHSLVVKLADEIARIETNLSKMDKSVRGYKQLVQAKDRMINNVRANGYEIISLLGQDYNDGMQFPARFVPDDSLPEGKRIITGMTKMQVNYNGKMIQPAEIVVSQNI